MQYREYLEQNKYYLAGEFETIVVGAGHAGVEAAMATARLGVKTLLLTLNLDSVANMPCNPNIGGTAKGQLVREIDALGGVMGLLADRQSIQFRMLNASKGPAVLSPRAQIDRPAYRQEVLKLLSETPNLILQQAEVEQLIFRDQAVAGVLTTNGLAYLSETVVLATGTYLCSTVIIGEHMYNSGPDGLSAANYLTESLREAGLNLKRFKTGTPPRFQAQTINFDRCEIQPCDPVSKPFSYLNEMQGEWTPKAELPCHLTWTTDQTQQLFMDNISRSPLYSGLIKGVGPRYCPSIEDKFVKFPDHERHHVFLEPTSIDGREIYASGLSTSMPMDVQIEMLSTIPGLEKANIQRPGYAIEYDLIDPLELGADLETIKIKGLFCAGQINGSSGYEEAAGQGLIAGINAARRVQNKEPVIIDRSQGYLGVLIDDLVTKGTEEPYRMMTSRAEYRLILRQDNADRRLTPIGYEIGLIDEERYRLFQAKYQRVEAEIERLKNTRRRFNDPLFQEYLRAQNSAIKDGGISLAELLKRPEITYLSLAEIDELPELTEAEQAAVEVEVKYEGYIKLEEERIQSFSKLERKKFPPGFDFSAVKGLRLEARQKLSALQPRSLGQASRISGVSPADISVLLVALAEERTK